MGRPRGSKNKSGNGKSARETAGTPERAASKTLVLSLVRRSHECKTRMQSIAGELGAEIKSAAEDKHLHVDALKLIAKCARMDELKRVAFLAAFDLYRTYAAEAHLFGEEHLGDLVDDAASASEQDEASSLGDVVAGNVEKLRRGIKTTPADGERVVAAAE